MPELPEVETLKLYMQPKLGGETIDRIELRRENLRYDCRSLKQLKLPSKVTGVRRRAKYLVIDLDNLNSLVVHLGMSGRFTLTGQDHVLKKHDHVIFHLSSGDRLVFNDARRFGMIYHCASDSIEEEKIFRNLGVEPLSEAFIAEYLASKLAGRKQPIKTALMDSSIVVGVGNIYASESLFLARIDPRKAAGSLPKNEIAALIVAVRQVLQEAVKMGGTTLKDFVSGDSKPGYFKQKLLVYGREGETCQTCGNLIAKIKQAGRSTFYCSRCQGA